MSAACSAQQSTCFGLAARSALVRVGPLSPTPGRAPTVTPHGLGFGRLALLWAVRVGRRALWVRWRDFFQMLPMYFQWCQGGLGVLRSSCAAGTERTVALNRGPLAVRLQVGCLGWLRARFKAVLKAHSTGYGWLIGSRMGASSVGLKRAGSADPVEEMAAGAFARLGLRHFLFVVGAWCQRMPSGTSGRRRT
eukprot:scaffold1241_cov136-Isochrysis_galbana.AAC.1